MGGGPTPSETLGRKAIVPSIPGPSCVHVSPRPRQSDASGQDPESGVRGPSRQGQRGTQQSGTTVTVHPGPGWSQQACPHWVFITHGVTVLGYGFCCASGSPASFGNCRISFQCILLLLKFLFATKNTWSEVGKF